MQRWVLAFGAAIALTSNGVAMAQPAPAPASSAGSAIADVQETAKLNVLFEAHWQATMREAPEFATYRGDLRYNDRLSDLSPEAIERSDAQVRDFLAQARAIRRDRLAPVDRTSLDMFIGERERTVAQQQFPGLRTMRIGVLGGAQTNFADLMRAVPMRTAQQARQLLVRMDAYPRQMEQEIALMRRGVAAGWVPGKDVMERGLMQLDGILNAELDKSPFMEPFKRLPPDVPAAERNALLAEGRAPGWRASTCGVCFASRLTAMLTKSCLRGQMHR